MLFRCNNFDTFNLKTCSSTTQFFFSIFPTFWVYIFILKSITVLINYFPMISQAFSTYYWKKKSKCMSVCMYTKIDRDCDRESETTYLEEGREWCFGGTRWCWSLSVVVAMEIERREGENDCV